MELLILPIQECTVTSWIFNFWLNAWKRQRFAGGRFAKEDDKKIELYSIAYSVVIKLILNWRQEIF